MSWAKEYQKKKLIDAGLSEKAVERFFKIHFFIWTVLKSIGMIWLAFKIYDRLGFEKTIILQLTILILTARIFFRREGLKQKSIL